MAQIKDYLKNKKEQPLKEKTIHTSRHALAKEISEYFHETKDYRKYLGVCYQYPEEKLRRLFAEIKEESRRNPKVSPVKIFFWKLKQLEKNREPKNLSKRRKSTARKSAGSSS